MNENNQLHVCPTCKSVNATGRKDRAYYRSDETHKVDHPLMNVVFSPSKRKDDFLLYFYWMQLECGCWIEIDVQRDFLMDEDEWFGYCLREKSIEKRLARVAELWEQALDEAQEKILNVLNIGAVKRSMQTVPA